jgi:5-methylcytosine-specific restriction enzyme B
MTTTPAPDPFADAADLIRDRVFSKGTSLLRGRDRLWRQPHLGVLADRVRAVAVDAGGGGLHDRWHAALDGADAAVVRLAAEALYVHLVIASDITPATKRAHIADTLAWLEDPPPLPPLLAAALDVGRTPTGIAFKRRRLSQVLFLLTAVGAWRDLPPDARRSGLADPGAFRDWLDGVPCGGATAQREALAHLVHPAAFEPITSLAAKRRIVATFGGAEEVDLPLDAALGRIRTRLAAEHGDGFSFGAAPLVDRWLAR